MAEFSEEKGGKVRDKETDKQNGKVNQRKRRRWKNLCGRKKTQDTEA